MAFRMTPIVLYLCGPPKIGKSHISLPIAKYLNSALFNVNDYVFPITLITDHWDGYKQQPIVIFDDHYKKQDDKQEIDAGAVMNVVSCTAFLPNFDTAIYKLLQFNSRILIINSNFGYPNTIYLPSALHRRHKHHVICIPNSAIMKNDFSHIDFYYTSEIIDPFAGLYPFPFSKLHDIPFNNQELKSFPFRNRYIKINLKRLCDIIVDDYNKELNNFENIHKFTI